MNAGASAALFERARAVTPGGVHSPVRAFRQVGGVPRFMAGGAGAQLIDVDGRRYLDFCLAFGPLILGHAPAVVRAAVEGALARGWSLGTAEPYSLALAEFVTARLPWIEQIRFMNSGTEAVMTALRVARAATGRARVLKFSGCYHGHVDALLVRAGSGLADRPTPDSAGVSPATASETLVAPLDDDVALEALFAAHGHELAAVIIEPVPANHGLLPQRPAFLDRLGELARAQGTVVIYDEVISGFRLGFGGAGAAARVPPDLVTYGKILGGGFPVGALGGRRDLMAQLAPEGPVYQAGTLSANPVTMAAGLATLEALADGHVYAHLEALGATLERELAASRRWRVQRVGSLFWLHRAQGDAVRSVAAVPADAAATYRPLFHRLLESGIYLAPSAFEVGFLSAAHTPGDIARLAGAVLEDNA